MRRMGRRWKILQQLIYVVAILACGHFLWLIRPDYPEAVTYSLVLVVLLGQRIYSLSRKRPVAASV